MVLFTLRRWMHRLSRTSRSGRRSGRGRSRGGPRYRPELGRLEDRLAPAVIAWDGGAGTFNWNDAARSHCLTPVRSQTNMLTFPLVPRRYPPGRSSFPVLPRTGSSLLFLTMRGPHCKRSSPAGRHSEKTA